MFYPGILDGTAENVENSTRVSLDFRLVSLKAYEAMLLCREASGRTHPEFSGMAKVRARSTIEWLASNCGTYDRM
jgi:hypothetical protein